jgi:hypothetical protein
MLIDGFRRATAFEGSSDGNHGLVSPPVSPGRGETKMPDTGWYADPRGRHELRWFDGEQWTDHVADAGVQTTDDPGSAPQRQAAPVVPPAPAPPRQPTPQRRGLSGCAIAAIVGGAIAVVGLILVIVLAVVVGNEANKALHRNETAAKMSLTEFNQISPGMTADQVNRIVGGPGKLDSATDIAGHHTEIRSWTGNGGLGSNANVTFQDGAMISKAQFGLQ